MNSQSTQTDDDPTSFVPRQSFGEPTIRITLGGLGFQEENSSTRTTPQLLGPFSPQNMERVGTPDTASMHDARTGALLLLIEHVSKILARLRQVDIPALTRRLKKQHLVGADVAHLSKVEMKSLNNDITQMRAHFKLILDEERKAGGMKGDALGESAIMRKDFNLLLKVFKEIFSELVELRGIVNDVTVNPAIAVEMKKKQEAIQAEEEDSRGRNKNAKAQGGLGWMAPITKLFAAPTTDVPISSTSNMDRKLLQPPQIRSAAKLTPSTSASVTQVSVEFASTGQVRRATHALPNGGGETLEGMPISPTDTLSKLPGRARHPTAPISRPKLTLGDGSVRGAPGRQSLYGIFAGVPTDLSTLPIASSSRQSQSTEPGSRVRAPRHKRQMSTLVDAVIDETIADVEDEYQPPLLERQLRPRGLSDSSIRTTFQHHGAGPPTGVDPTISSSAAGSNWSTALFPRTFGKRLQALAGRQDVETSSDTTADDTMFSAGNASIVDTVVATPPTATSPQAVAMPRAVTKKKSANQLNLISPASFSDNGGFLSMLSASSGNTQDTDAIMRIQARNQRSESAMGRSRASNA